MASGYGKKSLKDKFNAVVRKVVLTTALIGAVGTPGYYYYGTVHEKEVTITSIEKTKKPQKDKNKKEERAPTPSPSYSPSYSPFDDEFGPSPYSRRSSSSYRGFGGFGFDYYSPYIPPEPEKYADYEYTILTTGGAFKNHNVLPHLKSEKKSEEAQGNLKEGKTVRIKYYGWRIPFPIKSLQFYPNIISVTPVTDEELRFRKDIVGRKAAQQKAAAEAKQEQQEQALLGTETSTLFFVVDGLRIEVTAPKKIADKVTVSSVKPPAPKP